MLFRDLITWGIIAWACQPVSRVDIACDGDSQLAQLSRVERTGDASTVTGEREETK